MIWDNIGLVWSNGIIVGFHPVQARVRTDGGRRSVNLLIVISSFTAPARPSTAARPYISSSCRGRVFTLSVSGSINNQYDTVIFLVIGIDTQARPKTGKDSRILFPSVCVRDNMKCCLYLTPVQSGEHKYHENLSPSVSLSVSLSLSYPDSASSLLPHHHLEPSKSVTWLWAQPILARSPKLQISMTVTVTAWMIWRVQRTVGWESNKYLVIKHKQQILDISTIYM